jgi:hypothetical protein
VHEIKHDGYRLMARRNPIGVRLLTRNGHDSGRLPAWEGAPVREYSTHRKTDSPFVTAFSICFRTCAPRRSRCQDYRRALSTPRMVEGRKRARAGGVKFGPKFKLNHFQRPEALARLAAGRVRLRLRRPTAWTGRRSRGCSGADRSKRVGVAPIRPRVIQRRSGGFSSAARRFSFNSMLR